jgi:hypothetical protein
MKQASIQQPLLSDSSANTHVSTAIMEETFCVQSVSGCYNQDQLVNEVRDLLGFSQC